METIQLLSLKAEVQHLWVGTSRPVSPLSWKPALLRTELSELTLAMESANLMTVWQDWSLEDAGG